MHFDSQSLADGCSGRAVCSGYLSDWEQYLDMISDYTSLVPFMTQEGVRPPVTPPFAPPRVPPHPPPSAHLAAARHASHGYSKQGHA